MALLEQLSGWIFGQSHGAPRCWSLLVLLLLAGLLWRWCNARSSRSSWFRSNFVHPNWWHLVFMCNIKVVVTFTSQFLARLLVFMSTIFEDSLALLLISIFISRVMVPLIGSVRNFFGNKSNWMNGHMSNQRNKSVLILLVLILLGASSLPLLVLCNFTSKICKRTDTVVAFTKKYSRYHIHRGM